MEGSGGTGDGGKYVNILAIQIEDHNINFYPVFTNAIGISFQIRDIDFLRGSSGFIDYQLEKTQSGMQLNIIHLDWDAYLLSNESDLLYLSEINYTFNGTEFIGDYNHPNTFYDSGDSRIRLINEISAHWFGYYIDKK